MLGLQLLALALHAGQLQRFRRAVLGVRCAVCRLPRSPRLSLLCGRPMMRTEVCFKPGGTLIQHEVQTRTPELERLAPQFIQAVLPGKLRIVGRDVGTVREPQYSGAKTGVFESLRLRGR